MEDHEQYNLPGISLDCKARASFARCSAAIEAKTHGQASLQAQNYAFEACAYEHCAREIDNAIAAFIKRQQNLTKQQ